jgi:predicted Rossmann fold nucleotide-binding protein DprA/Smf involved in DNA uptake
MPVVSGGARGVDQISMAATLEAGGVTIGVLAENLLKRSVERSARHAIADGRLLLISPYHPNARFSVGTAMNRNKLIYAMADYGLVVSAEHKKGGTWAGATEELKRENARPVFVRTGDKSQQGNSKLLALGAIPWPESIDRNNLKQQLFDLAGQASKKQNKRWETLSIFDFQPTYEAMGIEKKQPTDESVREEVVPIVSENKSKENSRTIYQAVLPVLLNRLDSPVTTDDLAKTLDINKKQLSAWLKKAVEENKIVKLSRPVRYKKKT